jgi:hypothetical protein
LAQLAADDQIDTKRQTVKAIIKKGKYASSVFQKRGPSRPVQQADRLASAGLLSDFILDSLAYKSMHDREEEVTKSHADTFEWIFDDSTALHDKDNEKAAHHFTTWLATDQLGPIYWITGKPGSGKSTLTRFLFQHPSTTDHLQKWSGGNIVARAGFFFWTSGSREQRSQTGLLRSLLHQLLSSHPDIMPLTFPGLWDKLRNMTTKERINMTLDWTVPQLKTAFQAFVDAVLPKMRLCLFIDGLDEFDGNHLEIIHFFKHLGQGEHGNAVKMCLSSRPWAVFQAAFEHAVPHLRLQDLTYSDMWRYTRDRLREDTHVRQLLENDAPAADQLLKQAVERADGVFLWVRLAANEILDRVKASFKIDDLASMVVSLPSDLDHLFEKLIFQEQNDEQISQTATLFLVIHARETVSDCLKDETSNSLKVWELAFALDANDDKLALDAEVEEASDQVIQTRCHWTIEYVKRRFAGLLDLHARKREGNLVSPRFSNGPVDVNLAIKTAESRVSYIHRTVRDWLMEGEGIFDRLVSRAPKGFDPHLRLLRSYVLRLKNPLEEVEHHRRLDEWWPHIALALTHARYIRQDPNGLQRPLLNELNSTTSWYWREKTQDPYDHWARSAFGTYEVRMRAPPIWQPFLCLATKFGLAEYIREEVETRKQEDEKSGMSDEQREIETDDATPLLAYATEFLCTRNKTIFPLSDPVLVSCLLRHPCRINPGPNHGYSDFTTRKPRTAWIALLRHLRDARRRGWIEYYDVDPQGVERWATIVRMFVEEGGADVDAVVQADKWDPESTATGVVEMLDEMYGSAEVRGLKEMMVQKAACTKGKGRA